MADLNKFAWFSASVSAAIPALECLISDVKIQFQHSFIS